MSDQLYRSVLSTMGWLSASLRIFKPTILCFHAVTSARSPYQPSMAVTDVFIDRLLTALRRADIPVIAIQEAVERLERNDDRPFVVLTFDDGYRDNYTHLFPIMRRHQTPFTIFVTTGLVDRDLPMWWEVIDRLRSDGSVDSRAAWTQRFRERGLAEQKELLARLQCCLDRSVQIDPYDMALTWQMLREMAASGLLTVGAHTHLHPLLRRLKPADIFTEMASSRERIESKLGCPVEYFAYPYGQPDEIGSHAEGIAAVAGFRAAFTTQARPLQSDDQSRLFSLPRILLSSKAQRENVVFAYLSGMPAELKQWMQPRPPVGREEARV